MLFDEESCEAIGNFFEWIKYTSLKIFREEYEQKYPFPINQYKDVLFRMICSFGYLEQAKILYENHPNIDLNVLKEECFRNACQNGHLQLAKWLYEITENHIDFGIFDHQAFRFACVKNHFETAQWIYSLNPNIKFENATYRENLFSGCCFFGSLPMTKWLLEIFPETDIHFSDELIFRTTCNQGHLEIAQWLYQTYPDINIEAKEHQSFVNSCKKNLKNVALWLNTLKPEQYNIFIEDNKITDYSIKTNLEIRESPNNKPKQSEICPICQDSESDVITTCNHSFCYKCINRWHKKNDKCPLCKTATLDFVISVK